jgi:hypothetical protein
MVSITESCVLEMRKINSPYLIEKIKRNFSSSNGLFFRINQILHTEYISFMEIHDGNVIEAAENIIMNLVFHKGNT